MPAPGPEGERRDRQARGRHPGWSTLVPDDSVNVLARDDWGTLSGRVNRNHQRDAAEREVRKLTGVPGVVNNITPAPAAQKLDIRQRVMDALKRHAEVQADHIGVDVDSSGSIRLSGLVDDREERRTTCTSSKSCPPVTGTAMDPGIHARPRCGCRAPAQDAGQRTAVDGVAPAGGGRSFDEQDQPAPGPGSVGVVATSRRAARA